MTPGEWAVVAAGAAAIAWVNWYFFVAPKGMAVAAAVPASESENTPASVPEVVIIVQGGYSPATVRAKAGRPVRLVFDRQETSGCSEEIVFPDFNLRKFLPAFQKTSIILTPPVPGRYEFTCGMSMLRGTLVADA